MKKFQNVEGIALKVLKKGVEESKGDRNDKERSSDADENWSLYCLKTRFMI